MGFREEDHRGEMSFSYSIKGTYMNMTYHVDVELDHLVEVVFAGFLYYKITLFSPFPNCALWKGSS